MKDFLRENPAAKLVFIGSTDDRTRFYKQILSRHYPALSTQYTITALAADENGIPVEMDFDHAGENNYLAFLVKNKM